MGRPGGCPLCLSDQTVRYIQDFHRRFRTEDDCLQYLFQVRFPQPSCRRCRRKGSCHFHKHAGKSCYTCTCGRYSVYPRAGTIFTNSPLPLIAWFHAVFFMTRSEQGISARELQRHLKVTYTTAWRVARRIRPLIPDNAHQRDFLAVLRHVCTADTRA